MDTLSDGCVFQVAPTQEVAAVSNAAEDQQSHRLSFVACTRFNKLVAEGVPVAQAKQQVQQPNVSTIQSKRQHSEETVPTDTAKRAKTDTPSKSAGAEMSHRKAGPDVRVGVVAAECSPFLKQPFCLKVFLESFTFLKVVKFKFGFSTPKYINNNINENTLMFFTCQTIIWLD